MRINLSRILLLKAFIMLICTSNYAKNKTIINNENTVNYSKLDKVSGVSAETLTAPANLQITNVTESTVTLLWNVSKDNSGSGVVDYEVFQNGTSIGMVFGNRITVTGLAPNTNFSFKVRGIKGDDTSVFSAIVTGITQAAVVKDIEEPSVPSNLATTSITESIVSLSWTASTDNVGVTGYGVFNGDRRLGTIGGTRVTINITNLAANTLFSFRIRAIDAEGNLSDFSNIVNGTTLPLEVEDTEAPSDPTNLVVSNITENSAIISWTASTDNIAVASYEVFNGANRLGAISGTSVTVNNLAANTAFSFRVRAIDPSGNISDFSNTANGTTGDTEAPSNPASLTVSNITETTVSLTWSASIDNIGVTGYEVFRGDVRLGSVTGTTATISTTANTAFTYKVRAIDAAGNTSDFSNIVNGTTPSQNTSGACVVEVSSFPYSESFETNFGGWAQGNGDDFDWARKAGRTPSGRTGPTTATDGNQYIYMESSAPNNSNDIAILNSPCFNLSAESQAFFTFKYHMYGASEMGSLALEISKDNGTTWTDIWNISGNQGDSWEAASVDLSLYTGTSIKLRFNGVTGTKWRGDMAVDDIELTNFNETSKAQNIVSSSKNELEALPIFNPSKEVSLYPNPVRDVLYVKSSNGSLTYNIVNMLGKQVASGVSTINGINVSHLESGLYIIQFNVNETLISKKFVKK